MSLRALQPPGTGSTAANELQRSHAVNAVCRRHRRSGRFKKVNDTYGHDAGDEVLKALAEVLIGGIRVTDTVGRWGGEEFLFVLPETSQEGARVVLDRIRKRVSTINLRYRDVVIPITISIGMSYCESKCERDSILKEADLALYEAKHAGKNRVLFT
jgi:diguanylate cyclase (GGDEF)-like protein